MFLIRETNTCCDTYRLNKTLTAYAQWSTVEEEGEATITGYETLVNWGKESYPRQIKLINNPWIDQVISTTTDSHGYNRYYINSGGTLKIKWRSNDDWNSSSEWRVANKFVDPKDRLREIIQQRMAPAFHQKREYKGTPLPNPIDFREERARETLRVVVGEKAFNNYMLNGYVIAKNRRSGMIYKIHPGHRFTDVYQNGKKIDRLCVILKGDFPPTDSVIVRYLMVLNNENEFWKLANKFGVPNQQSGIITPDSRSLREIFADLKNRKIAC